MPWLWRLNTSTATKAGLTVVFALGFLLAPLAIHQSIRCCLANNFRDIIVAILRIFYLVNTSYAPGSDFLWESTSEFIWLIIEPSLGVIVACAAVLRPVFHRFPSLKTSLTRTSGSPFHARRHGRPAQDAYSNISANGGYVSTPYQRTSSYFRPGRHSAYLQARSDQQCQNIRRRAVRPFRYTGPSSSRRCLGHPCPERYYGPRDLPLIPRFEYRRRLSLVQAVRVSQHLYSYLHNNSKSRIRLARSEW